MKLTLMGYSCIIPLGPDETLTEEGIQKFYALKSVFDDVLLVSSDSTMKFRLPPNFRRVASSKNNRAHQMNIGAEEARGDYLSFLYFDSEFDSESFARLRLSLKPRVLFYFPIEFQESAPVLCKVNAVAANWRADMAGLPFGDQCFTMDKKSFLEVGAFSETVTKGEDIEFLRRWKKAGFSLRKARGLLRVSPQPYLQKGWLKTSFDQAFWTLKYWVGKEPRPLKSI